MSFLDSFKSFFGISKKKKDVASPENAVVASSETLTSSSNGYKRYESAEGLTVPYDQSNLARINSTTPSIKTTTSNTKSTMLRINQSSLLHKSETPTLSTPSSLRTRTKSPSPITKPFFTTYKTPFNTSQTETEKRSPIPPKTKFSSPSVKSVPPSSASISASTLKIGVAPQTSTTNTKAASVSTTLYNSENKKPTILPKPQPPLYSPMNLTPSASISSRTVIKNRTASPFQSSTSHPKTLNTSGNESKKPIPLPKPRFPSPRVNSPTPIASISPRTLITQKATSITKPIQTQASSIPSQKSTPASNVSISASVSTTLYNSENKKPTILPKPQPPLYSPMNLTPSASISSLTVIKNRTASPFPSSTSHPKTLNTSGNESKKPIPLPKPRFLSPRVNSPTPIASISPRTLITQKATSITKPIQTQASSIPSQKSTPASYFSISGTIRDSLDSAIPKSMGTRQNKKKILIDTSASKTSSNGNGLKSLSGLNLINKNELTSKIQPVDSGENQSPKLLSSSINKIKPKLLHSNQQKPATVSKTFSSNSSSSTELQPLASILTTAAGANNSEASRKVVNSTSKISNGKKTEIKKITVSVPKKQETTPTLNKQKKKKTWNEKKSLNRLNDINKNNNQKNSNFGFVLPEETLSIENYYKSCNLTYKNGVYLDPNGVENEFLMGCLIFDENKNFADGPLQPDKVLPDIYLSVLNAARANKKILSSKLLKCLPNNFEILSKLRKKIVTPEDAGKKFEVFTYLQLIEEFLESDEPLAKGATITCEAKQSEEVEQQKNRLQNSEKNEEKKVNKSVLYVSIPFEKDSHVEENIKFMGILYLIPDNDVKNNVSTIILEVKVAKILPSVKKGPTNLITVIGKKELKQLRDLGENIKKTFSIFVVPYVMATNAILKSVKAITSKTDLASKVFPPYKNNANDILKFRKQMFSGLDSLFYSSTKSFNQKQKEAIYSMTRPVNTTFILFGPPGTGKTYTLVETIRQLLNPSSKKTSTTDRTILVCTPSNMAADAIAEGIIDGNFLQTGEIFRLVSVSRDTFKRNLKLDCITQRQVLTDNREQTICTIYDLPNTALLKEYKIIICTLGSIPKLCLFLEPGHFSHIFVDEAAQAPEMDVWLAVGHLATRDTRIILAGDPKQLGPVTTVNLLSTNENYGYKKSLLARLVDKNVFNNDPRYLIQLTENHRSHEGIVKISSELFYENTLIATKPIGHDSLCRLPFLQKNNFPILFHSVNSGKEETSVETRSKRNLAEVSVIVEYVKKCLHQNVAAEDIGVVSPYTYQAESIRKSLNNKDITVDTVEKYQGSERRVIIISCVRTCGKLGFMADNLRFNTAITRAKHLLIVVGHVDSMSTQKSWKRFIDYCGQNGSLVKDFQKNHESIQHSLARLRI